MITQLNPPLPLETPKGSGLAHFVIDYGPEADLLWVGRSTAKPDESAADDKAGDSRVRPLFPRA